MAIRFAGSAPLMCASSASSISAFDKSPPHAPPVSFGKSLAQIISVASFNSPLEKGSLRCARFATLGNGGESTSRPATIRTTFAITNTPHSLEDLSCCIQVANVIFPVMSLNHFLTSFRTTWDAAES